MTSCYDVNYNSQRDVLRARQEQVSHVCVCVCYLYVLFNT